MSVKHPFRWTAVFTYYAAVLYLLLTPADYYEGVTFPYADKLAHLSLFLILGALLKHTSLSLRAVMRWGIILAGISELLQRYTPTRTPDPFDFLVDVLGIILGAWFLRYAQKKIVT